jgi:2-keto-4-pentenoate hydratase/2-oxohepta-3-ene-1,7-dioic acid hydratase in catechol pathway
MKKLILVAALVSSVDLAELQPEPMGVIMTLPASCLIAHQRPIEIRSYYGNVHPEPELAVVIG